MCERRGQREGRDPFNAVRIMVTRFPHRVVSEQEYLKSYQICQWALWVNHLLLAWRFAPFPGRKPISPP